jgi:hypothetical protein
MKLMQGATYEATVQLGGLEAAFASPQDVAKRFAGFGFAEVHASGGKGGRFRVVAVWARPNREVDIPSQMRDVRMSAPPPDAEETASTDGLHRRPRP